MAIFNDFEEFALLRFGEERQAPVIQDQELDPRETFEHDRLEQRGGRRADRFGVGDEAGRRPSRVPTMGARHVLGDRRVAAPVGRARMAGDALPLVEGLDRLVGEADVDELADQPERRGIPVAVDFNVVVGGDAAALPDGEGVRLVGELF